MSKLFHHSELNSLALGGRNVFNLSRSHTTKLLSAFHLFSPAKHFPEIQELELEHIRIGNEETASISHLIAKASKL
jgi:hypothetical protein